MPDDTFIGGSQDQFPLTHWSAIVAMRSPDAAERQQSREAIVSAYWKPVYKYLRLKWRKANEDAKDLTQGFFAEALEKGYLENYDPAKARFRTFLRICLDGYVANENKAAQRLKRGGGAEIIPLDFENAEGELQHLDIADHENLEDYFEKEWLRSLFALALEALREECCRRNKQIHLQLFESYDLSENDAAKLTYGELATRFNLPVTQVTNYLSHIRREFRRILLEKLREITGSDEEFTQEARTVLGVHVK